MQKKNTKKRKGNRYDPSRTQSLRRKTERLISRYVHDLRRELYSLIVRENALGILSGIRPFTINTRWAILDLPDKVRAIKAYLLERGQRLIDSVSPVIDQAFSKGIGRSFMEVLTKKKNTISRIMQSTYSSEVIDQLNSRSKMEHTNKVQSQQKARSILLIIKDRLASSLSGIYMHLVSSIASSISKSLVRKDSKELTYQNAVAEIPKLKTRMVASAQGEVVAAQAEGQLLSYQENGITTVTSLVEWITANDDRVCPLCADFEGEEISVEDASGLIPAHIGCRCSWAAVPVPNESKMEEDNAY